MGELLSKNNRKHTILIAWILSLGSFVLHFILALMLYYRGDLFPINLYFDADIGWYLTGFETGVSEHGSFGGRGIIHPNINNVVYPLVGALSNFIGLIAGKGLEQSIIQWLALSVVPLAAGAATGFLFLTLASVRLSVTSLVIAIILSVVAFSSLLFGAIPESHGLSGAAYAYLFYLVSRAANEGKITSCSWLFVGTILFSITITHIVPYAIVLAVTLYFLNSDKRSALISAGDFVFRSMLFSAVIFIALTAASGSFSTLKLGGDQLKEIHLAKPSDIDKVFEGYVNTILPPQPNLLIADNGIGPEQNVVRMTFRKDLDEIIAEEKNLIFGKKISSVVPRALDLCLFLLALLLSLQAFSRLNDKAKMLWLTALSLLCYNFIFFMFFGKESFLYSQNWFGAEIIFISLGMIGTLWSSVLSRLVVSLLAVVAAIHSLEIFLFIFSR